MSWLTVERGNVDHITLVWSIVNSLYSVLRDRRQTHIINYRQLQHCLSWVMLYHTRTLQTVL